MSSEQSRLRAVVLDPSHELHLLVLTVVSFLGLAGLFFLLFPVVISVEAQQSHTMVGCHKIVLYQDIDGYAPPVDLYADVQSITLSARCGNGVASITAGSSPYPQYVYKYGYIREDGEWRRFQFTGPSVTEEWLQGPAYATFARTPAQLREPNHVVAFMCTWYESAWRCGCSDTACAEPHWTLQTFARTSERVLEGDEFPFPIAVPDVALFYPSQYIGGHGTRLTLTGYGFDQTNNTVIFRTLANEDYEVPGVPSRTTESLSVVVPDNVPYGVQSVIVQNAKGRSNSAMFTVKRPGSQSPTITSVSPSEGRAGIEITVQGDNFAPTGNIIYYMAGMVPDVPSPDGHTLRFTFSPLPGGTSASVEDDLSGRRAEYKIQVANENGMTKEPASFYWTP